MIGAGDRGLCPLDIRRRRPRLEIFLRLQQRKIEACYVDHFDQMARGESGMQIGGGKDVPKPSSAWVWMALDYNNSLGHIPVYRPNGNSASHPLLFPEQILAGADGLFGFSRRDQQIHID